MTRKLVYAFLIVPLAYIAGKYFLTPPPLKGPIIPTALGKVQGIISKSREGRDFFGYLGIPYAQPPVGELRYEPPEPWTKKWDGVRDAIEDGAECIQVDSMINRITGKEDCLFVNVFSPRLGDAKLPVMVWIHGGLFNFGTGNIYRPDYLMDHDVVVVTVNYRLGSFGFLNTADGLIRGNMGLKDQNMALRWVKANIHKFGGNPNDVTIFGESAGGASVHYQMISPMSKGLFQKAMAQSGLTTMTWAYYKDPQKQMKIFAAKANCDAQDTKTIVKCLKSKDAMDLVELNIEVGDYLRPISAVFVPTIEKDINDGKTFIAERPLALIEKGQYNKVPFLTGVNSEEGLLLSTPGVANATIKSLLRKEWPETIQPLLFLPEDASPEVLEKIRSYYLKNEQFDVENPMRHYVPLSQLASDYVWNLGINKAVKAHQKHLKSETPLFLYHYSYEGEFGLDRFLHAIQGSIHPIVGILSLKMQDWFNNLIGVKAPRYGACHGDELPLEWNMLGLASVPKDSPDYTFSQEFVKTIIQFVKLDPKSTKTPSLEFMGEKWEPHKPREPLRLMNISIKPKMIDDPFKDRIEFWESLKLNI